MRDRLNLPDSMSFDDYVDVDKDVETTETVTEQKILADLLNLHEEEDGEETRELNPICSLSDAKSIWRKSAAIFYRTIVQSRKIQPQ